MESTYNISGFLKERQINRLCHITQIDKLFSILYEDEGILATDFCDNKLVYRNDLDRMDGKTDYISTSVEYPNVWYYENKKNVNPYVNSWAVIFIDPALLCEKSNTLFCPINSAASRGAYIKSGLESFKTLFDQRVGYRRRTSNMLNCCPTDDQAEVLIYKHIPANYITGVAFETEHTLQTMVKLFEKYSVNYPDLFISEYLFTKDLSRLVRDGCRPLETIRCKGKRESVLKCA